MAAEALIAESTRTLTVSWRIWDFIVVFRRFAPDWLTARRFLQRSRGEVTKYVKLQFEPSFNLSTPTNSEVSVPEKSGFDEVCVSRYSPPPVAPSNRPVPPVTVYWPQGQCSPPSANTNVSPFAPVIVKVPGLKPQPVFASMVVKASVPGSTQV